MNTFKYKGHTFAFAIERDDGLGEPWKEHDGHGVVSEWVSRDKNPGELVLVSDRGSKRYYDVEATTKIAAKDGWGIGFEELQALTARLKRIPTRKEVAAEAVQRDYDYLRRWCNDDWSWANVDVTMLDEDEKETDYRASLCGIESDAYEYHQEVCRELAEECLAEYGKIEETKIAATHGEYLVHTGDSCGLHWPNPCGSIFCPFRGDRFSKAQVENK